MYHLIILIFATLSNYVQAQNIISVFENDEKDCSTHQIRNSNNEPMSLKRCGAVTYYLSGKCEEIIAEIKKINSNATPDCVCKNSICKAELSAHLPTNLQRLLRNPNPYDDSINCYNTLLHALGFKMGFHQSQTDIEYLILSPLCIKREGRPKPGDVIWASGHGFYALTEDLAFNKSGPGQEVPFEVIKIDDYFLSNDEDPTCQFISSKLAQKKKCESNAVAYKCNIPEYLKSNSVLGAKGQELANKIDDCTYSTKVLGKEIEDDIFSIETDLLKIARYILKTPTIKSFPPKLLEMAKDAYIGNMDPEGHEFANLNFERYQQEIIDQIYLYAAKDMRLDHLDPKMKKVILETRKEGIFPNLPVEERVAWALVVNKHTGIIQLPLKEN